MSKCRKNKKKGQTPYTRSDRSRNKVNADNTVTGESSMSDTATTTDEMKQDDRSRQTNWEVFQRLKSMGMFPDGSSHEDHPLSGQPKMSVPLAMPGEEQRLQLQVDESERRYEAIRKEAEANMQYYCKQARDGNKPWFHYPRKEHQYSEYILVTPEMAQEALQYNNNPRKRVKRRTVEAYSRDMKSDRWIPTDESLSLDYAGEWYNGQHRFNACILSGTPTIFYVTFNSLIEARFGVDQGVVRSATEKLDMMLENNIGTKLAAVCRAMMRGVTNTGLKWTDTEICQFAQKHGGVIEWVAKSGPGTRADVQAVIAKAALWYGIERIEPFVKRYTDVMFKSKDDPARRLYEFVLSGKKNGGNNAIITYKKTLAAIHHEISGKSIRALYERDKDIFEWGPDWTIPARPESKE